MQAIQRYRLARANDPNRRGFALVGVMICFVAISLLVVSWFKAVSFERQQLQAVQQRLQAEWLTEAAIERAIACVSEKLDYSGETWHISAAELSGSDPAIVEIHVAAIAGHSGARSIQVVADYPADPQRRVRRRRQVFIDVGPNSAAGEAPNGK